MPNIKDIITDKLKSVNIDINGKSTNIIDAKIVEDIVIANKQVFLSIKADKRDIEKYDQIKTDAHNIITSIEGVEKVSISLTAHSSPSPAPHDSSKPQDEFLVKDVIAIASGKGGVGKSTTTINLAIAVSKLGFSVGILDADIYGPSVPKLVGVKKKPALSKNGKLEPISVHGISVMSIGFLVDEETPMIWRGPMVISAVNQLIKDVDWGDLDFLFIDMPPGTGDVQLTMAQRIAMSGAIIVSTPQDLALIDAKKGLVMFEKVNVPILGIIENMSSFICPHCNEETHIFGKKGAEKEARSQKVDFLGAVPLMSEIREASDLGEPFVIAEPESSVAQKYMEIAEGVVDRINKKDKTEKPKITIES